MPIDPTPIRKRIFEFPTPNLNDRVFHERHDSTQMNYVVPPYGTLHPNQTKYEGFKLAMVKPADEVGWVLWFYLNERLNQDEYNYEIQYPYPDTDYPIYVRTYVLLRSSLPEAEPAAGSEYPPEGSGFFLTDHKQVRLQDPMMDSLFVGVQRIYERLPGPEIYKYRYNERGDLEQEINQVVPGSVMPDADGLFIMESGVNHDSTVKGTRKVRKVEAHSALTTKKISEEMRGAAVIATNTIVSPLASPDPLSLTTIESQVVARTATKAEKLTVHVDAWPELKSKSYPAEYKGVLATSTSNIVTPATPPDTIGVHGTQLVVESQVVQRDKYRAEKTTVTIPKWPILYDYIWDGEINRFIKVTSEVVPKVGNTTPSVPITGTDVEYRAIDDNWTSKITRTVVGPIGTDSLQTTQHMQVEYNIPAIIRDITYGYYLKEVKDKEGEVVGKTAVWNTYPYVQSARRVIVMATITTTYNSSSDPQSLATNIIPTDFVYDGIFIKLNLHNVLTANQSGRYFRAGTGTNDYYWPYIYEEFYAPSSTPTHLPDTIVLPEKVSLWKYNLYKHEKWELDVSPYK